jgi:hypothetical protein
MGLSPWLLGALRRSGSLRDTCNSQQQQQQHNKQQQCCSGGFDTLTL